MDRARAFGLRVAGSNPALSTAEDTGSNPVNSLTGKTPFVIMGYRFEP